MECSLFPDHSPCAIRTISTLSRFLQSHRWGVHGRHTAWIPLCLSSAHSSSMSHRSKQIRFWEPWTIMISEGRLTGSVPRKAHLPFNSSGIQITLEMLRPNKAVSLPSESEEILAAQQAFILMSNLTRTWWSLSLGRKDQSTSCTALSYRRLTPKTIWTRSPGRTYPCNWFPTLSSLHQWSRPLLLAPSVWQG